MSHDVNHRFDETNRKKSSRRATRTGNSGSALLRIMIRRKRRGVTLAELLFSVPILAIASLGVLSVLTFGAVAGDTAGEFSQATQYGREVVEYVRADRYNLNPLDDVSELTAAGLIDSSPDARTAVNAPPLDDPTLFDLPDDPRFKRNIQIEHLVPNRLAKVQVRIYYCGQKGQEKYVETVAFSREAF